MCMSHDSTTFVTKRTLVLALGEHGVGYGSAVYGVPQVYFGVCIFFFLGGQRGFIHFYCLAGMLAWMEGYMVIIGFIGYISNGRSALLTNIDRD